MEVVDGLYRRAACCELRRPAMPCIVKHNLTDEDVLAIQIQANALRPETTAMEYARQIKRIMEAVTARQGRDATLADVSKLDPQETRSGSASSLICSACGRTSRRPWSAARYRLARPTCSPSCRRVQQAQLLDLARTTPAREFVPVAARPGQADSRGGPPREAARFLPGLRAGAAPAALEGSACRVPRAPPGRPGRRRRPAARRRWTAGTWRSQWALNLDEESVREQREKFLARDPRNCTGTEGRAM